MQPSEAISKWVDSLINTTLSDVMGSDYSASSPAVNISENESHFILQLAAPGLTKQDINVNIENDHLVISAEKNIETEGRITRREFNYGSFKRSFRLDNKINRDGIVATYQDGVLKLTLPKKAETAIKASSTIEII